MLQRNCRLLLLIGCGGLDLALFSKRVLQRLVRPHSITSRAATIRLRLLNDPDATSKRTKYFSPLTKRWAFFILEMVRSSESEGQVKSWRVFFKMDGEGLPSLNGKPPRVFRKPRARREPHSLALSRNNSGR